QDFKAPGMIAGNENPPFHDKAGSFSRRAPMLAFMHMLNELLSRPDLTDVLRHKIGAFLMKICMAYADVGFTKGGQHIWKLLPKYFKDRQMELREETNLL